MSEEQNQPTDPSSTEQASSTNKWDEVANRESHSAAESEAADQPAAELTDEHEARELDKATSEELSEAQETAKKYHELMMRTQAEFENYKRRSQRDIANARNYGAEKLLTDLIPVLDGFEQGLAAYKSAEATENELLKNMGEGLALTNQMLIDTLTKHGVEQVDPLHEKFNPEYHEAMSMVEDPHHDKNTVIQVFQKGYVLNGRLIRAARVIVAKG